MLLRPELPPSEVLIFSLAAGLAVRAAILELAPHLHPDLKWPNDVLLDGKKFCGILTEMNAEVTRVRYLVIGDRNQRESDANFPAELREIATSLRLETGTEWSRVELCAALLKSLDREYRELSTSPAGRRIRFCAGLKSTLLRCAESRFALRKMATLEGTRKGLDNRGFLQVRTAQGLRTVLSGTVRSSNLTLCNWNLSGLSGRVFQLQVTNYQLQNYPCFSYSMSATLIRCWACLPA